MKAIAVILTALLALAAAASDKKVVCYFGSWSVYRTGDGNFDVSYIDPKLCTHLIYSFVGLTDNGEVKSLDAWNDLADGGGKDNFNHFTQLRQLSPETKIMVAIGGWTAESTSFSRVTADPNLRHKFVENIVSFVRKYGFDGFDLDWEYPAQRLGSSPADKQNFVELVKEIRQRFDQEGLILSAAVAAAESSASISYNIPEISKYLHFINLMTYDLHGVWEGKTGMNAPLRAGAWESGAETKLNVDAVVHYWLSQGAPADKLVLGVPFYGRAFTLSNPQSNGIGAPSNTPGNKGPYTQEAGMLGYNEVCEKLKTENWQVQFNEEQKVPYAVNGNQWVSYDDERSLKEKMDYVKELGLGGAMVWSIETDDFLGKCGEKFPLLKTLNRELRSSSSSESHHQTSQPTYPSHDGDYQNNYQPQQNQQKTQQQQQPQQQQQQQEQQQPQQPQPPSYGNNGSICQGEGYVQDPNDSGAFYYCQAGNDGFIAHPFHCPAGLVYIPSSGICDYPPNYFY